MSVRDVSGVWELDQSNGYRVKMTLEQDPEGPNGAAPVKGDATTTGLDGAVKGFVTASTFVVTVDWDRSGPGRGGEYSANFHVIDAGNKARLIGHTWDLENLASNAKLRSRNIFSAA